MENESVSEETRKIVLSDEERKELQTRAIELNKRRRLLGRVASAQSFLEKLSAGADEDIRDMNKPHFIVYATIAMFAALGIVAGGIAVSLGAIALGEMIMLAALPLLAVNSLFSLGKSIYDYLKMPVEGRTPLDKFKLMTAPVSAILASAVIAAAALLILSVVPGGLFILGGAAAVYGIFKLWQGYQARKLRKEEVDKIELELSGIEQKLMYPLSPKSTLDLGSVFENIHKEAEPVLATEATESTEEDDEKASLLSPAEATEPTEEDDEKASLLSSAKALVHGRDSVFATASEEQVEPASPSSQSKLN